MTNNAITDDADSQLPAITEIKEITLRSQSWHIAFFPDGSGSLSIGSLQLDKGVSPQGSFSFEEIYTRIGPKLLKDYESKSKTSVTVGIKLKDGVECLLYILDDPTTIQHLMAEAGKKNQPIHSEQRARFERLIKVHSHGS